MHCSWLLYDQFLSNITEFEATNRLAFKALFNKYLLLQNNHHDIIKYTSQLHVTLYRNEQFNQR